MLVGAKWNRDLKTRSRRCSCGDHCPSQKAPACLRARGKIAGKVLVHYVAGINYDRSRPSCLGWGFDLLDQAYFQPEAFLSAVNLEKRPKVTKTYSQSKRKGDRRQNLVDRHRGAGIKIAELADDPQDQKKTKPLNYYDKPNSPPTVANVRGSNRVAESSPIRSGCVSPHRELSTEGDLRSDIAVSASCNVHSG